MVIGLIEVLDHVVDVFVEPGEFKRILAEAHLQTEALQRANIPLVAGVDAFLVATGAVFKMQVVAVFDVRDICRCIRRRSSRTL